MGKVNLQAGDFSGLAEGNAQHRPNDWPSVPDGLLGLLKRPVQDTDAFDVSWPLSSPASKILPRSKPPISPARGQRAERTEP